MIYKCRALGALLLGGTLLALPGCGVQTAPVTGKPLVAAAAPQHTPAHPPPGMVWIPGGTFRMGELAASGPQVCEPSMSGSMAGMTTMSNFADAALSDMAGNVWEWCADWYRPSGRGKGDPLTGASNAGFRCAL